MVDQFSNSLPRSSSNNNSSSYLWGQASSPRNPLATKPATAHPVTGAPQAGNPGMANASTAAAIQLLFGGGAPSVIPGISAEVLASSQWVSFRQLQRLLLELFQLPPDFQALLKQLSSTNTPEAKLREPTLKQWLNLLADSEELPPILLQDLQSMVTQQSEKALARLVSLMQGNAYSYMQGVPPNVQDAIQLLSGWLAQTQQNPVDSLLPLFLLYLPIHMVQAEQPVRFAFIQENPGGNAGADEDSVQLVMYLQTRQYGQLTVRLSQATLAAPQAVTLLAQVEETLGELPQERMEARFKGALPKALAPRVSLHWQTVPQPPANLDEERVAPKEQNTNFTDATARMESSPPLSSFSSSPPPSSATQVNPFAQPAPSEQHLSLFPKQGVSPLVLLVAFVMAQAVFAEDGQQALRIERKQMSRL